jgi:hypothetical protein
VHRNLLELLVLNFVETDYFTASGRWVPGTMGYHCAAAPRTPLFSLPFDALTRHRVLHPFPHPLILTLLFLSTFSKFFLTLC